MSKAFLPDYSREEVDAAGHALVSTGASQVASGALGHALEVIGNWRNSPVIVVDTGQGAHLLETGKSLHPYALRSSL